MAKIIDLAKYRHKETTNQIRSTYDWSAFNEAWAKLEELFIDHKEVYDDFKNYHDGRLRLYQLSQKSRIILVSRGIIGLGGDIPDSINDALYEIRHGETACWIKEN